jgi:hypothetical protein
MIRLDTTSKSIRIYSDATATTSEPVFVTSYDDIRVVNPAFTPGSQDGSLNGTTPVTAVSSPVSPFYRNIKYISVANVDTAPHTVTIELLNGVDQRTLMKVYLEIGEELVFSDAAGWMVMNSLGEIRVTGESGQNIKVGSIGFGLDNGANPLTIGTKAYVTVPFSGTIVAWVVFADQIGDIQVDVWKDTYDNYPPTVADSIPGSDKPRLVSQIKNRNTNLTGWTDTTVNAGDIFAFNIDSVSTITRVTVHLKIMKD